jgi:hypothetical protein
LTRLSRPTALTKLAMVAIGATLTFTAVFLAARYPRLPDLLPVHFRRDGMPNGWQYKTPWRVLVPFFVQALLTATLGAIAMLLLSRSDDGWAGTQASPYVRALELFPNRLHPSGGFALHDTEVPADVHAAATASEAVMLMTFIWVAFQAYAAVALAGMWQRERAGLGVWYTRWEYVGIALTAAAAIRAHRRVGRPESRPFVAEHWRFGQLYKNADDPALFVPTRDGSRWTLNFGRPVAAALIALILGIGVLAPTMILGLMLR